MPPERLLRGLWITGANLNTQPGSLAHKYRISNTDFHSLLIVTIHFDAYSFIGLLVNHFKNQLVVRAFSVVNLCIL